MLPCQSVAILRREVGKFVDLVALKACDLILLRLEIDMIEEESSCDKNKTTKGCKNRAF